MTPQTANTNIKQSNDRKNFITRELRIFTWLCSGTTARARSSSRLYSLEVGNRIVKLNFTTKQHIALTAKQLTVDRIQLRQLVNSLNIECNGIIRYRQHDMAADSQTKSAKSTNLDYESVYVQVVVIDTHHHCHFIFLGSKNEKQLTIMQMAESRDDLGTAMTVCLSRKPV